MDKIVQFNENCHPVFCEDLIETYSKKTINNVLQIILETDKDEDWELFKDDIIVNIMNKIDIYKNILYENIDIRLKEEYEPNIIQLNKFNKSSYELRDLFVVKLEPTHGESIIYNFFKKNTDSVMSFCIILNDVDAGATLLIDNIDVPTNCGDLFFFPADMNYQYKFPKNMPQYILMGEVVYKNTKSKSIVNYIV